ncbi:hypothetical protein Tco_0019876 [Tanacetum coccineum]
MTTKVRTTQGTIAKPVKADLSHNASRCPRVHQTVVLIELETQVQRLMEAHLLLSYPSKQNHYLYVRSVVIPTTLSTAWKIPGKLLSTMRPRIPTKQEKAVSEKLDDTPTHNTVGNPAAQMNFASTNYPTKEELRGKGIKSLSKLLFLKYLSQSSLVKQNRNPSSPKWVHFVNSIIILNKEDEAKEEGSVKSSATENKDHEMTVESEEEFKAETEEETEEEEEDNRNILTLSPL